MKYLKQTAWYGSAVAIAAIMAVALLFAGPAQQAHAAMTSLATTCNGQLVQTNNNSCTITFTTSVVVTDAAGGNPESVIDLLFDTDTAPTGVAANYTVTGPGGSITVELATVNAATVRLELGDVDLAVGSYTVTLNAGAVLWQQTVATGISLEAQVGGANTGLDAADFTGGAGGDGQTITTMSFVEGIQSAQSTVIADGISTAVINFNTGDAAGDYTNADILTFSTNAGTFTAVATGGASTSEVIATDGMTMTAATTNAAGASGATTITLKSGTTVETATIKVFSTPAGGGTAVLKDTITVSFTLAAGAAATGSMTTPSTAVSVNTTGTEAIVVTFLDADTNAPVGGESVSVSTTIGKLTGNPGTGGSCTDALCKDGTLANTGLVSFSFVGGGVSGGGTITVTAGTIIVSIPVIVTGTGSDFSATTSNNVTGASGENRTTYFTVTVLDANGNVVPGVQLAASDKDTTSTNLTITADASGPSTDSCLVVTGVDGKCDFIATAGTATSVGAHTIKITLNGSSTELTTATVTVVGAAATVVITAPDTITALGTTTITVSLTTAEGDAVASGTAVTVAATGNGVIIPADGSITTSADTGDATFTLVASADAGDITLVAIVGALDPVQATVTIGDGTTPAADTPAAATAFTAPPAGGLTQGVAGTTDFQALIDAQTFTVESIWKLDVATQVFQTYIPGGLEIANTLTSLAASDIVTLKSAS